MTKNEAVAEFKRDVIPTTPNDITARRTAWNDFTNCLYELRLITKRQWRTWCHPACVK